MGQIVARHCMSGGAQIVEILNAGVITIALLLGGETVALLPGPSVTQVQGQAVPGAFDHVHEHRVIEALPQRKTFVQQVGVVPIVRFGLGKLRIWRDRRQHRTAETRVRVTDAVSGGIRRAADIVVESVEVWILPGQPQEGRGRALIPGQRSIGEPVAAVAHVSNLQSRVGRQFLLDAEIESLAVAHVESTRIHADHGKQESRVNILIPRLINTGIAAIPVEGTADLVRALESRRKAIGNTLEVSHAHRHIDETERSAKHGFRVGRIGKADLGAEVFRVFVFFEAVAAAVRKNQLAGKAVGGINGLQVDVGPVTLFLVEAEIVVPAQSHVQGELRCDLVAVLGEQRHRLLTAIQVESCRLARCIHISQEITGEAESDVLGVALTRSAGRIGVEVERERAGSAVAIDLVRVEIASEREAVPAFRPGHRVAGDNGGPREVPLEGVTDEGFVVAVHRISERDERKIRGPGIAETQLRVPIAGGRRRVPLIIEVVGEVQNV